MDVIARDTADRLIGSPVDVGIGVAARRVQRSKRVREGLTIVLAARRGNERGREQRRSWAGIGRAVGRIGRQYTDGEGIDRSEEISKTGSDAGSARPAEQLSKKAALLRLWRPGQANAGGKTNIADRSQRIRNRLPPGLIPRIENSRRRPGKDHRLRTRDEGRYLVVLLRPGCDAIPAETVVESQIGQRVPTILREQSQILITRVEGVELALVVLAGHADKEVGEIDAGFLSGEDEASVKLSDRVGIHLVHMKLTAELDRVVAQHLGKGVGDLVRIVRLNELIGGRAGREAVEVEVLDALPFGVERHDAGSAVRVREAL